MEANAAAYRRSIQTSASGKCWDFLVLTAANEKQAEGYRQELAIRSHPIGTAGAFFPAIQRAVVVADPPGRRAGSGGATFGVLESLHREHGVEPRDFARLHILLIHSGGASQRLPAYSPVGKIFAPLPLLRPDGQIATLFDHLYLTLAGLPERIGAGMLILAGDVVLLFDHRDVERPTSGVTAISMRVEPQVARGHGAFVTDARGRILQTLQKQEPQTLRERGAMDANGRVLIDTGILFFDPSSVISLAALAGIGSRKPSSRKSPARGIQHEFNGQIDLYDDITAALAAGTDARTYRAQGNAAVRNALLKKLHGIGFQAAEVEGEFLHLGTTLQFRDAMIGRNPSPAAALLQQNVLTHSDNPLLNGSRVYHSVLLSHNGTSPSLGEGCVVEHSVLGAGSSIGAGSVVSQATAVAHPIQLPADRLLFQAPVRVGNRVQYVQVVCGVEDDFKGKFSEHKCGFLNRPITDWLSRNRIKATALWKDVPPNQQTLWTARLFVGTPQRDAAGLAVKMSGEEAVAKSTRDAWRKARRYSMAMILEQADPASLIEHREMILAQLQTRQWIKAIEDGQDLLIDSAIGRFSSAAAYHQAEHLLRDMAAGPPASPQMAMNQARALWSAAQLLARPDHPMRPRAQRQISRLTSDAFAKIAQASEIGHQSIDIRSNEVATLQPSVQIEATAPVRLDLAGGWSDTPPYCYERGGHVVNIAIDLNGEAPIRAFVRTLREPKLILESHDQGQMTEVSEISAAEGDQQLTDAFALHKVALGICGLLPKDGTNLAAHLKGLGAGLHVATEARVPKGSGLGTSSILAATLLAALGSLRGHTPGRDTLIEQTLLLEQRLSTGGGWQDQIGGIIGGMKSTTTEPGVPQRPCIEKLALPAARLRAFEERLVVFFSGDERLARDILRQVMGRWLSREPAVVALNESLKKGAGALRSAVLRGRWLEAARHISQYWQMKKELYPRSTTAKIDQLFQEHQDHCLAAGLAGAGGGGFAYFLCRDARQAATLRQRLTDYATRPGNMGSVYQATVNLRGLTVRRTGHAR